VKPSSSTFHDCDFQKCRMVYAGGEAPVFESCRFEDCDWKFEDAAARTLEHMKAVWNAGGKQQLQALIKDITSGGAARS
jgi:hypothetical protein